MRKLKTVIVILLLANMFLFANNLVIKNKIKSTDISIDEKKIQIDNNKSQIESLVSNKEKVEIENELVEKEYEVWIHQNEKLENLLH